MFKFTTISIIRVVLTNCNGLVSMKYVYGFSHQYMDIVFLTAAYAIFEIAMDDSAETMCQLV